MRFVLLTLLALTVCVPAYASNPCFLGKEYLGKIVGGNAERLTISGHDVRFGLSEIVTFDDEFLSRWHGADIKLYSSQKKPDRHGRIMGHGFLTAAQTEIWMQGALLATGKAVVNTRESDLTCRAKMLALEQDARLKKLGVWKDNGVHLSSQDLELLSAREGHFQLVTGKIISIGDRKKRFYLNFGSNWKQDFTVVIEKTGKNAYGGDLEKLKQGVFVRVRGILENNGGPMIRVNHEAQIEFNVN